MVTRTQVTGLVLAGGQSSRMDGADKGLQLLRGCPLALRAVQRLAPQVASVMISANRHLADYRAFGVPVWPDATDGFEGPLAGILAGLEHCGTPLLAVVPCDVPNFPVDLVERLADAMHADDADVATALTIENERLRPQPLFCLMKADLHASLRRYLAAGGRKVQDWLAGQRRVEVMFADTLAFININTLADLRRLDHGHP